MCPFVKTHLAVFVTVEGCFRCFRDLCEDPIENGRRSNYKNSFNTKLYESCNDYRNQPIKPLLCCCAYMPCMGSCCVAIVFRTMVLDNDLTKYQFLQGYSLPCCFPCCCCQISGKSDVFRPCHNFFYETCCCPASSIAASRMYAMDKWNMKPDPIENRSTRMSACIVDCLTICLPECKERPQLNLKTMAKNACNTIASSIFNYVHKGCMVVQVM